MAATSDGVELSVIVAAEKAGLGLRRCLTALYPQLQGAKIEVIVADGSAREPNASNEFPFARWLRLPEAKDVPVLWSAGIAAAQGSIVAMTIEECVPAPDWVSQILRTHSAGHAAIGGAIEPGPELGLVDWAVYFCRYTRYMLPATPGFRDDLAGDNCSYKRAALEGLRDVLAEGFWETFVHRVLLARDQKLRFDPEVVVRYGGFIGWGEFTKRRFAHARFFAARRAEGMRANEKLLRGIAFPVVPFLLLVRIISRVWRKRRYRAKLFLCLPVLFCYLLAWGCGEGIGYLLGRAEQRTTVSSHGKAARFDE